MKRIIFIIFTLMIAACMAGCGSGGGDSVVVNPNATLAKTEAPSQGTEATAAPSAAVSEDTQDEGLYFESNGVKIHPYDMAQDVLKSLGTPRKSFEAPSCAYQGTDNFYTFNGFQIQVNSVDDADHVTVIIVIDDTVSIPQGVKVGSTKDEMLAAMGSDYTETTGLYQFVSGTTTLQIQVKDGKVIGIQYVYTPQK
jgi:hypothetical protein